MKRNYFRLGAAIVVVSLAVAAGWWIQRDRSVADTEPTATQEPNDGSSSTNDSHASPAWDSPSQAVITPTVLTPAVSSPTMAPIHPTYALHEPAEDAGNGPANESHAYPAPMPDITPVGSSPLAAGQVVARGQDRGAYDPIPEEPNPLRHQPLGPAPIEAGAGTADRPTPADERTARGQAMTDQAAYAPRSIPSESMATAEPLGSVPATSVIQAGHGAGIGHETPMAESYADAVAPGQGPDAPISGLGEFPPHGPATGQPLDRQATPIQGSAPIQPVPSQALSRDNRPIDSQPGEFRPNLYQDPMAVVPVNPSAVPMTPNEGGLGANPPFQADSSRLAGQAMGRPGEQALEGAQTPSLTIEKLAPEEIQVGKQCTFEIVVRNTGKTAAHEVLVYDEIPQGTQWVGASPQANQDGNGRLVWDIGTLGPGEEQTVELQLMPIEEGDIGSVATVSFASKASIRTHCTRPLLELRTTADRQVMIGDEQVIAVEVHNPGTGDATGVMLLENIPERVSHPSGASLEYEVGTLRAGETRTLDLVLKAEQAGIVQNRLVAQGDANVRAESMIEFEVIAPELRVSIDGPSRRYLEREAIYTVAVENPGTAPAKDIELLTRLPKGMQFVKANNLGEYDASSHSVHWSLAELPPSERGTVELVMLAVEPGEQSLEVETRAAQGLADQTEQPVVIEGLAAIMFEVVDVDDPIEVGGETSYEIRVVNQGSKTATNLQVVASLPPGMTATGAYGPVQHQIGQGQVLFAPLARLAPKADTTYRVDVQGLQPGDQRFRVQVVTSEVQQPITKEESTRVYTDQ